MTEDYTPSEAPICACGDLAGIVRLGLEGRDLPPCEVHRAGARPAPPADTGTAGLNSELPDSVSVQ